MSNRVAQAVEERDALRRRFPQLPPWQPPEPADETADAMRSVFAGVSERDLLAYVLQTARLHGWLAYHSWSSVHSEAGWPDVVAVKSPRIVFAELKREGRRPTEAQWRWLDALRRIPGCEVFVWKPSNRAEIAAVFAGAPAAPEQE